MFKARDYSISSQISRLCTLQALECLRCAVITSNDINLQLSCGVGSSAQPQARIHSSSVAAAPSPTKPTSGQPANSGGQAAKQVAAKGAVKQAEVEDAPPKALAHVSPFHRRFKVALTTLRHIEGQHSLLHPQAIQAAISRCQQQIGETAKVYYSVKDAKRAIR